MLSDMVEATFEVDQGTHIEVHKRRFKAPYHADVGWAVREKLMEAREAISSEFPGCITTLHNVKRVAV